MQRSEAVIPDSLMFDFVLKRKKFRSFFSLSPLFENVSILFDFIISSGIYSRIFKIFFSGTAFFRLMDSILFCFLYSMLLFSLAFSFWHSVELNSVSPTDNEIVTATIKSAKMRKPNLQTYNLFYGENVPKKNEKIVDVVRRN